MVPLCWWNEFHSFPAISTMSNIVEKSIVFESFGRQGIFVGRKKDCYEGVMHCYWWRSGKPDALRSLSNYLTNIFHFLKANFRFFCRIAKYNFTKKSTNGIKMWDILIKFESHQNLKAPLWPACWKFRSGQRLFGSQNNFLFYLRNYDYCYSIAWKVRNDLILIFFFFNLSYCLPTSHFFTCSS